MDEMDIIQEIVLARQDATMLAMRERMERERLAKPPAVRGCSDCGCDIPAARLAARPHARMCVDCQSDVERTR